MNTRLMRISKKERNVLSTMIKKWRSDRPNIFILSGAGLSVESGIPTYRGAGSNPDNDSTSLSAGYMRSLPERVFNATNQRIKDFDQCKPNAAHKAIAEFVKKYRLHADIIHVTQNIDSLCEEAGDTSVFHLHGSLNRSRCQKCGAIFPRKGFYKTGNVCPNCQAKFSAVRPDVVLFGETPYGLDWIVPYLKEVDIFIAIGTSGTVYPAADFVNLALNSGVPIRMLLNKEAPHDMQYNCQMMDEGFGPYNYIQLGSATAIVPKVLKEVGQLIENISTTEAKK